MREGPSSPAVVRTRQPKSRWSASRGRLAARRAVARRGDCGGRPVPGRGRTLEVRAARPAGQVSYPVSRPSGRGLAPRFLQAPLRDGALALRRAFAAFGPEGGRAGGRTGWREDGLEGGLGPSGCRSMPGTQKKRVARPGRQPVEHGQRGAAAQGSPAHRTLASVIGLRVCEEHWSEHPWIPAFAGMTSTAFLPSFPHGGNDGIDTDGAVAPPLFPRRRESTQPVRTRMRPLAEHRAHAAGHPGDGGRRRRRPFGSVRGGAPPAPRNAGAPPAPRNAPRQSPHRHGGDATRRRGAGAMDARHACCRPRAHVRGQGSGVGG